MDFGVSIFMNENPASIRLQATLWVLVGRSSCNSHVSTLACARVRTFPLGFEFEFEFKCVCLHLEQQESEAWEFGLVWTQLHEQSTHNERADCCCNTRAYGPFFPITKHVRIAISDLSIRNQWDFSISHHVFGCSRIILAWLLHKQKNSKNDANTE